MLLSKISSRFNHCCPCHSSALDSVSVKKRILEQFERRAPTYDSGNDYHPPLAHKLIELANLKRGEAVLDLACGTGLVTLPAAEKVGVDGRVVGIDMSPEMIKQAASKPLPPGCPAIEWVVGDAEAASGLAEESFDAMFCSAALPFMVDVPSSLAKWRLLLKPAGGRLLFNTFGPADIDFWTIISVARSWGLTMIDPCEVIGKEPEIRSILSSAGYSHVDIAIERKERRAPALSIEAYADSLCERSFKSNPFTPISDSSFSRGGEELSAFKQKCLTTVVESIKAEGRWLPDEGFILSPYIVFHVVAHP